MNRFDRRRWFGDLPELPDDTRQRDPDHYLTVLRKELQERRNDDVSRMFTYALVHSRLDALSDILSSGDWGGGPRARLHSGHLGLYRAVAENPDSPELSVLDSAASDFVSASESAETGPEASAGLIRIALLQGNHARGTGMLGRLERFAGTASRRAAVGARLFFAEYPGTGESERRKHLQKARRFLKHGPRRPTDILLLAALEERLGQGEAAVAHLRSTDLDNIDGTRHPDADYMLLERQVMAWTRRMATGVTDENPDDQEERQQITRGLKAYRDRFPSDPRVLMLEGEFKIFSDVEAARMAWRGALVLDDRHAPAWGRLGDLYREAWERDSDEHGLTWLEAAGDAYRKAVSLSPLSAYYRKMLGNIERNAGRPGRAVGNLAAALALVRDDRESRRLLALSWTDLAYSRDLGAEARMASAARGRSEWERLLEPGYRDVFDLIGLCRTMVLQGLRDDSDGEDKLTIAQLIGEITDRIPPVLAGELIPLADDLLANGMDTLSIPVLDSAENHLGQHHRILGLRGASLENSDPAGSIDHYLQAGKKAGSGTQESSDWICRAASVMHSDGQVEQAVGTLREALSANPRDRNLLRDLASYLSEQGRGKEAFDAYSTALDHRSPNPEILEDAIWFARGSGMAAEATGILDRAIELNPADGRAWNQRGVHQMETGWDESLGEQGGIRPEALTDAIDSYRKAVAAEPENNIYRGNLGDALRQAGLWTEAAEIFEDLVDESGTPSSSGDVFALNSLARLEDERSYAAEGTDGAALDWDSAGIHYRKAAEAGAGNPDFLRDYAWWLYRERRLEEAAGFYHRAAGLAPEDESLPHGESVCWKDLGIEDKAIAALDRALAISVDDPVMMCDKAELLGASGENPGAVKLFEMVLDKTRGAEWARERYAAWLEDMAERETESTELPLLRSDGSLPDKPVFLYDTAAGQRRYLLEEARRVVGPLDSPDLRKGHLARRLGSILLKLGEPETACRLLLESRSYRIDDAPSLNLVGRCELARSFEQNDHEELTVRESAGRYMKDALDMSPGTAGFSAWYAVYLATKTDWKNAHRYFQEAWERDGSEPVYLGNAGISALKAHQYDTAVRNLEVALDHRREPEWLNALGLARMATGNASGAAEAFQNACLAVPDNETYLANLSLLHAGAAIPDGPLQ